MKKIILSVILLGISFLSFAAELYEIQNALKNSQGYYVSDKDLRVYKFSYSENPSNSSFSLSYKDCYVDFLKNEIKNGGTEGRSNYFGDRLKNEKSNFILKDGKIDYIYHYNDKLISFANKSDKELFDYLKERTQTLFNNFCGSYTDKLTGRIYILSKDKQGFKLSVQYNEPGLNFSKNIKLDLLSPEQIAGEGYEILYSWYSEDQISLLDPNPSELYEPGWDDGPVTNYYTSFKLAAPVNNSKAIIECDLGFDYFNYFAGNIRGLSFDKEGTVKYSSKANGIEKIAEGYKTYKDKDGWKHFETDEEKFIFIMGDNGSRIPFNYHKASFRDDTEAQDKTLMDFSRNDQIKGTSASSVLVDKSHTYGPQGAVESICLSKENDYYNDINKWCRNNIPWVEGVGGDGIGEFMEVEIFPDTRPSTVAYKVSILPGYVDPIRPYLFKQNNRPKKLLIETDSGFSQLMEFDDEIEFKTIEVPKECKKIRITIKEVYRGSKYADTCISCVYVTKVWWDK